MNNFAELRAAILEAGDDISDQGVEGVIGLIDKILAEDLMGLREVAALLGTERSAANMRRYRGHVPAERTKIGQNRIWARWDFGDQIPAEPARVSDDSPQEAS